MGLCYGRGHVLGHNPYLTPRRGFRGRCLPQYPPLSAACGLSLVPGPTITLRSSLCGLWRGHGPGLPRINKETPPGEQGIIIVPELSTFGAWGVVVSVVRML